jgi:hypothetical protein
LLPQLLPPLLLPSLLLHLHYVVSVTVAALTSSAATVGEDVQAGSRKRE